MEESTTRINHGHKATDEVTDAPKGLIASDRSFPVHGRMFSEMVLPIPIGPGNKPDLVECTCLVVLCSMLSARPGRRRQQSRHAAADIRRVVVKPDRVCPHRAREDRTDKPTLNSRQIE